MSERIYYRIRFPAKAGTFGEFYQSNNGTDRWSGVAKVKALLGRGQPKGYKVMAERLLSDEYEEVLRKVMQ